MRASIFSALVALGTALTLGAHAGPQPANTSWVILASGEKGPINAHTTRESLIRAYGMANVQDQDVDLGEGETAPGTVLFPKDEHRSIEIVWKDSDKKTEPQFLTIRGCVSDWMTVHNISLGTSLRELEKLNGRPFHLAGFDWDYSGTVTSWDGGTLATELNSGNGRVILRFSCSGEKTTPDEQLQVAGDGNFSSRHPVMQKMNPIVGEIVWEFPK